MFDKFRAGLWSKPERLSRSTRAGVSVPACGAIEWQFAPSVSRAESSPLSVCTYFVAISPGSKTSTYGQRAGGEGRLMFGSHHDPSVSLFLTQNRLSFYRTRFREQRKGEVMKMMFK